MVPLVAGISKITTGVLRLGLCEQTCKKDDNKMLAGSKTKKKALTHFGVVWFCGWCFSGILWVGAIVGGWLR
jgi:hypothetical protein